MKSLQNILALFLLTSPLFLAAQDIPDFDTLAESILYRKEMAGSVSLHTLGYGAGYRTGHNKTYYLKRMLEFDLLEMKSPKEVRRYNEYLPNSRRYVYGKENNIYILRAGIGQQKLINRKPYWGGIEVRYFYYGGPSLALAKPVYLYIAYYSQQDLITYYDLQLEKYDPQRHFPYRGYNTSEDCDIAGRGPFLEGLGEIKPYPGIYAKAGFNFEFGQYTQRIKALEAGVVVDVFPKAIPIMAFNDPYRFFVTAYISFSFGKRYN
ncbi:MAG TPA: hypothetical protein PLP88_14065 [Bacteroidales bacterium]|nr:hypothetical protein [Bacteroidales bacterium]